jgi:hypothetical protein
MERHFWYNPKILSSTSIKNKTRQNGFVTFCIMKIGKQKPYPPSPSPKRRSGASKQIQTFYLPYQHQDKIRQIRTNIKVPMLSLQ